MFKRYMSAPPSPPPPSPFAWGNRDRLGELLGKHFDLRVETGTTVMRVPDEQAAWTLFINGYGPLKMLHASLDADRQAGLQKDFMDFHAQYRTELGVALPREYVVAVGTRR